MSTPLLYTQKTQKVWKLLTYNMIPSYQPLFHAEYNV